MSAALEPHWVKNYQPGVPAQIELPTESLTAMMEDAVERFGSKVALEFFGAETTYKDLGDRINRAAEGLRKLGVRKGHRVAVILPNCPQYLIAFYAVLRLGAVVVGHNPLYTERELRHQFENHGAKVAIVWDKAVEKVQDFPGDVAVETIVAVNITKAMPRIKRMALALPVPSLRRTRAGLTAKTERTMSWEELLDNAPLSADHPRPSVSDLAALQYTSGTTGIPKGVMLTHYNLRSNALQGKAWMHGAQEGKEVIYGVLPMFHAFGLTLYLTFSVLTGSRLVLFPKFDVDLVLSAAKKSKPTVFCAVPPIYEKTAHESKKRGVDLSTIRYAISGAMTLPAATVKLWEEVSGGLLVEGYGLTESSPVALGNPFAESRRNGTIGVPFPSTEMRVVDPENPVNDVEPGAAGELLVRGPQVFAGYWNNPEDTAEVLLDGGWLRTGDIVTVDEDGFVKVVDRRKELIITGGFNVSPSEVEDVLRTHQHILDAAVVGLPRADGGEQVVAAVVLQEGAELDEAALRAYCRERLTPYKVPRKIVVIEDLPKSMLGKVLRRQVRDALLQDA
ncbi:MULTISPECIES: long-chain-fatty-acid--CoA ligase [Arthrobacter]|uniref:Long-chain-fatty-acid--CoA ligase n=1 Tax=Arthrobacter jinronghuae TaxID=2964609 RepID=A0ABT1NME9_9MICC|nr:MULTISPECIES: long-chain-fatty-acid--CoA ligase [Arthrobacter]MCQ1948893.1 long-chain-fatty-acid--CoA ligase [Arthrobacter jinronghuae]MCQ1952219.1 long-chain-fatty-acid--CoA ligase [Arthrobacter sp. zg-Y238]UWX80370.1 long-chain-fatty-acid--CoA ligase [Arthrobacter jinronghuae]